MCDCMERDDMTALQHVPVSTPPDFQGTLRKRLENVAGKVLAVELAYDESHIGKYLNGNAAMSLAHVQKLMKLAKLKAVDETRVCVKPDEIRYLRALYARVQEHACWLLDEAES